MQLAEDCFESGMQGVVLREVRVCRWRWRGLLAKGVRVPGRFRRRGCMFYVFGVVHPVKQPIINDTETAGFWSTGIV